MIRCSRLNEAEHCGLSGAIDDGETKLAGLLGDAFHAAAACRFRPKEQRFQDARAVAIGQLGGEHEAEVMEMVDRLAAAWTPPENAEFEAGIGLSRAGIAVAYDDPEAITRGTADCVWVDGDEVVVLDFKSGARAAWNVPIPRHNLQLAAYGFAFADRFEKSKVRVGIYLARDDKWLWDLLDLDSPEATALWARVRAAALRDPNEAVIGPHCDDCWVRLKCRAHIVTAISTVERTTALAPLGTGEEVVEPRRLMRMIQACKAMEDLAEAGKEWLKAYVKRNGPIVVDDRQWGPVEQKGREGTSVKKLKEAGLYDRAVAVGAVSQGPPVVQHRWTKRKDAA